MGTVEHLIQKTNFGLKSKFSKFHNKIGSFFFNFFQKFSFEVFSKKKFFFSKVFSKSLSKNFHHKFSQTNQNAVRMAESSPLENAKIFIKKNLKKSQK